MEQLLKTTNETALAIKAVKAGEFERVMVGSTVQEKAVDHPLTAGGQRSRAKRSRGWRNASN